MNIILIRHGETRENHSRVVQLPDANLSEAGLAQGAKLAKTLSERKISKIISSDMNRAAQTAALIAGYHNIDVEHITLLHERNLGDLRGQSYDSLDFNFFAQDYVPPNGESWEAFHTRVDQAWQLILEKAQTCESDLVVVTHGLVCRRITEKYVQLTDNQVFPERWSNTSVTIFNRQPPHTALTVNNTEHLEKSSQPATETGAI